MKPWWYLKSPHPTSARCCVPCHPCHGKPASTEVHAPLFGEWKPQSGQQGAPITKPETPESSPHQTTQPCKETSTAPWWGGGGSLCGLGNSQHPTTPTTPQRLIAPPKSLGAEPHRSVTTQHGGLGPTVRAARPRQPFPSSPLPIVHRSPALTPGIYNPPFRRGIVCRQPRRAPCVLDEPGLDSSFPRFPVYGAREEPVPATPQRPL